MAASYWLARSTSSALRFARWALSKGRRVTSLACHRWSWARTRVALSSSTTAAGQAREQVLGLTVPTEGKAATSPAEARLAATVGEADRLDLPPSHTPVRLGLPARPSMTDRWASHPPRRSAWHSRRAFREPPAARGPAVRHGRRQSQSARARGHRQPGYDVDGGRRAAGGGK